MDAAEDDKDVQLQKASSALIPQFEQALKPFLWKTSPAGGTRLRRWVRERDLLSLISLLEPFQEWPQLLDPHLEKFLPLLSDILVQHLRAPTDEPETKNSRLLVPLPEAICKVLYTFCKIRGEKVVVRFFNAEARNLELLVHSVEIAGALQSHGDSDDNTGPRNWTWEERYICLLWLSHLFLAPFDLATISSDDSGDVQTPNIDGLSLPQHLPGITLRVVPLAMRFLGSPGKERDAAKALLVRTCMRKDMQELDLLRALVQWACICLESPSESSASSAYFYIGILSFLGGILASSLSTSDMDSYLAQIFHVIQNISEEENSAFKTVHSSALARKAVIKVLRSITVITLRGGNTATSLGDMDVTEVVEYTIGHLLESLSNNDTPVRLAASKALSVITLKLAPDMAGQIVDAVLDSLNRNVLWQKNPLGPEAPRIRDLSAVNPLEWHGLMLTLSHLLYRQSPPPSSLPDILHALLIGLTFERRSTSGSSVGTNVRDAACFGVWSLARRYKTSELQGIATSSVSAAGHHDQESSILQVLATELVVSSCLDPVGNIRRGASASLQELIGRHPDTTIEGITAVQVVDYHAVALRSRAMTDVASRAALLSPLYEDALIHGLLGWRGIGDGDAASRRNAAAAMGSLAQGFRKTMTLTGSLKKAAVLLERVNSQIRTLKTRELDQRHGLLLSMAAVISAFTSIVENGPASEVTKISSDLLNWIKSIIKAVRMIIQGSKTTVSRHPELAAEAISRIISASCPLIRIACFLMTDPGSDERGTKLRQLLLHQTFMNDDQYTEAGALLEALEIANPGRYPELRDIITLGIEVTNVWLHNTEKEVISAATDAAVNLTLTVDSVHRTSLVDTLIDGAEEGDGHGGQAVGSLFALVTIFPLTSKEERGRICDMLLQQWQDTRKIESKVAILQSLTRGPLIQTHAARFIEMVGAGLDDYTTDARGDIGSLVRLEAVKAAKAAFQAIPWTSLETESQERLANSWFTNRDKFTILYGKLLRLAAEKLDKVRTEAQQALAVVVRDQSQKAYYQHCLVSSYDYFRWLLDLQTQDWLGLPFFEYQPNEWTIFLFEGYVSSADTGSEGLIRASRAALVDFCEQAVVNEGSRDSGLQIDAETARDLVCETLVQVARKHITNDRVLVSVMEVMSFLFDAGIMQQSKIKWRSLYLLIQKAHYKSGNVRKLEAAVKLYGGLLEVYPEAVQKLVGMLLHPFPNIRNQVADTLYVTRGVGKGVNWARARKDEVVLLKKELGIE